MGYRWGVLPVLLVVGLAAACADRNEPPAAAPVLVSATWPGDVAVPKKADPLPATPVGRSAAIYLPDPNSRDVYLVTETGRQYRLVPLGQTALPKPQPTPAQDPGATVPIDPTFGVGLSPDGRWLTETNWGSGGGRVLRDLTGTATVALPRTDMPRFWSPGGRLLLLNVHSADVKDAQVELDPATGTRTPVAQDVCGDGGFGVVAVLDDGKLLCKPVRGYNDGAAPVKAEPGTEVFRVAAAGGGTRQFTVDLRSRLADKSTVISAGPPDSAGHFLALAYDGGRNRAFVVSLADGKVLREVAVPAEKVEGFEVWLVGGFDGDKVIGVRRVDIGSPTPIAEPIQVTWLADAGAPKVVATFPREAVLILRGTTAG